MGAANAAGEFFVVARSIVRLRGSRHEPALIFPPQENGWPQVRDDGYWEMSRKKPLLLVGARLT
jgi:hypothetical protein